MEKDSFYKKKKKARTRSFLIGLIITIAFVVMSLVITDGEFFFAFAFVSGVITLLSFVKKSGKIRRSFCPKCHAHFDYENDVEWDILSEYVERTGSTPNSGAERKARMKFYCTCPECGNQHIFLETVKLAFMSNANSNPVFSDPDTEAKKLFFL